jgi:gluconokinase
MPDETRVLLIMGVMGSGKTTVGRAVAEALRWPFEDADVLHPEANLRKLEAGEALTDADRAPWLQRLAERIGRTLAGDGRLVLACSALKASYRHRLLVDDRVRAVFLDASEAVLRARLRDRRGHFAHPGLLASQLATLEVPSAAEALRVDGDSALADQVAAIVTAMSGCGDAPPR